MKREPSRWNQALAKVMFAYGCIATGFGVYVQLVALFLLDSGLLDFLVRGEEIPFGVWLAIGHMITFFATFYRDPLADERYPRWAPLIHPSPTAILVGRLVLFAASCSVAYWIVAVRLYRSPWAGAGLVAALFLLSAIYTVVHWALRPENIFSWRILGAVRFGLYSLLLFWWLTPLLERRWAKRRATEWLQDVLESCETAAKGRRLVNSETPAPGEVNLLEFQHLLLDELEHHRPQLSADGFREIQRFIRSVEALRHGEFDQEKWRQTVREARSVLAIRDKLTVGTDKSNRQLKLGGSDDA